MDSHLASSTPFPAAASAEAAHHLDLDQVVAHIQNDSSPKLRHLHMHASATAVAASACCSAPSSPAATASSSPSFFLLHRSQSLPSQEAEQQEQQETRHERGGGRGDAAAVAVEGDQGNDDDAEAENESDRVEGKHDLVQQQQVQEEQEQQQQQYGDDQDIKQEEEEEEEIEQEAATIIDDAIYHPQQLQQEQEAGNNDRMTADGDVNQLGNDMIMTKEEDEDNAQHHQGENDMIIMTTTSRDEDEDDDDEDEHVRHQLTQKHPPPPPHHHHYDDAAAAAAMDHHHGAQLQLENNNNQNQHQHQQLLHHQPQIHHHMHCGPYQFPAFSSSSSDHHSSHLLCRINVVNSTMNDYHHGAFAAAAAGFCPPSTSSFLNSTSASADSFPASSSPQHLIHVPSATRPPIPTTSLDLPPVFSIHHSQNQQQLQLLSDQGCASPHPPSDFVTRVSMDSPAAVLFKRKRGRPRKPPLDVSASSGFLSAATSSLSIKRGVKKARIVNAAAAAGASAASRAFKAHVIDIAAGEDLLVKIMSFLELEENLQGMCILSANGAISNVALTSAGGAMVTYEGRFEILSLSGSFLPAAEHHGAGLYNRGSGGGGGLRVHVSLGGANGHIVGGEVAGIFVAASPVKVVVATFLSSEVVRDSQIHEENQWSMQPIVEAAAAAAARESASCNLSQMSMVHGQSQSSSGAAHSLQSPEAGGADQRQLQPYHSPNTMAAPPQTSTLGNWGLNQIDTRT